MIARAVCEAVFREAVLACDPAARVSEALERAPIGTPVVGLAIGKASLAMARGAGPVDRGLVVTPHERGRPSEPHAGDGRGETPSGWRVMVASHPVPDAASMEAGAAAVELVESAGASDTVLALISGGASSLVEQPLGSADEYRQRVLALVASGAPIRELNALRTELSAIKGGKLAARSAAPIVTLIVSDVIGDDPRVVGSGPTIRAGEGDRVEVIAPMALFGAEVHESLVARGVAARYLAEPIECDVHDVAARLARETEALVAWGEPTVSVPAGHGTGGRAQQLALALAEHLRGTSRSAFVAGSDGRDGPTDAAGAFVDGTTWDAIIATGIDPTRALERRDAGTALLAVGALVITGATGINHADIVIVG